MKKTRNGMRITGLLLTMVMLVALLGAFSLTASAAAAEDISVTIDTGASITLKDTDGDGAYEIGNADELYAFAAAVNGGNTAINGELTANIVVNQNVLKDDGTLNGDGSNFRVWTPIGIGLGFMGIFDGNGHTISGLYLNDDTRDGIGLFREINFGTVRGVGVIDSYIRGRELVGGIAGSNWGNVEYCYNVGTVVGTRIVAGVVGGGTGTVENCYNTGNVSGISEVGGVIGFVNGSTKVINCYNTGDVSGTDYIGGIGGASYGEVENCYNTGNVSGTEYVGGVTGYYGGDGDVTSCYYLAGTANGGINGADVSGQAEVKDAEWFDEYPICRVVGFSHEWADGSCTACGYVCIHDGEVTPATCQKQAVCETCGESYGELAEDNHNFDEFNTCVCGVKNFHIYGQQLNVGGDLSMKYYVTALGDGVSTETLTMEFLFLGKKTEVSGVYDSEIGMYVFTLDGINPQCMGDEIDAYLLLDGEEKANKLDYTVEANLLTLREKYKDDTALVTLVNDILAYGSAASEYKGYGSMTDDYVSSDREIPTTNVAPSDAFTGYTVTFGQMNYIKIRVNLADGNTLYLGETDITNELVDGIYKTAGIAPTDFDNVFNFTVKNGDETVATFALSVNDYISANKDSESMGNLVKALYNYGVSAEEYARPIINLTQYADGETIDITQSSKIIGDGTEYNLSLNIAEDVTVVFDEGTGGVKLNAITVADNKTLTLQVKGNAEHIVKEGISLGNGANVIIEGDLTKENNKLTVTATDGNAGIGANNGVTAGDITIRNARVEATGSSTLVNSNNPVSGAAIGTSDANMGDILIENSIITATGSAHGLSFAAAIGSGSLCRSIGNIVFVDSEITAKITDETLASVIGAGSIMHGEKRLVCTMGDIIFTNTSLDLSIVQNLKSYGALIGIGETGSYHTVKMGKIIFTDMTQAELDAIMATWTYPEDFAEWGAYMIGRSPYNMVDENGTIEGVYVSDGNGGTVQIGNADGYNPTGYVTNWGW